MLLNESLVVIHIWLFLLKLWLLFILLFLPWAQHIK